MLDGMRSGAHSFVIKIAFGLIILVFIFGVSEATLPIPELWQKSMVSLLLSMNFNKPTIKWRMK